MRKMIIVNILFLLVGSAAFAADPGASNVIVFGATPKTGLSLYGAPATPVVTAGVPAAGTILIGKTSTGVGVGWNTATLGYAVNTQHINGTKAFGTTFDSTAMYQKDEAKGTAEAVPSTTGSDAFSGWSTM